MPETIEPGTVWLVGAGPGDPDLLTRKAEKLIAATDIVFYDALVGPGILDLIPARIERVSVGKRSGRHSKDQDSINDLLLAAAQTGKRVVRLKGGDPAIFGRTAEEVEHLSAHGVRVRICPGITAASAAVASAGSSLTLRGSARKLTFITAHMRAGDEPETDWAALADRQSTLAIYMGKAAASEIASHLIRSGRSRSTPVLVVENASLPDERLVQTRLDLLAVATSASVTDGPAVLIIGEAVSPHKRSMATGVDVLQSTRAD
ncbi:MAG: uroporphyrinogen-III C-methyltransferase [Sphingomonadales bacterium]|jgi:uroporphyrin-III C-methyltransferase|nr:uroporphyrinogen-III C-methyltransferase [Sphingomonadales bacterium]MBK9004432.1 uroporphyrinogen-III C-methyltransferase [Sphingomonadales bacterium]MBK9269617.1 uroporphyrinogen-III C-methyltransferase [Sphingomonadales bacterium]MBP6433857.1 uroporphyrinogen-III C-methyltransferase [Sphingorhabdus sp.]